MSEQFNELFKDRNFVEKVFQEMVKENYGNMREIFKTKGIEITSDQMIEMKNLYSEVYKQIKKLPENDIDKISAGLEVINNEFKNSDPSEIKEVLKETRGITNLSDEEMSDAAGGLKASLLSIAGFIGKAPGFVMKNKIGSGLAVTGVGIGVASVAIGAKDISDGNYKEGVGKIVTGLLAAGIMGVGAYHLGKKKDTKESPISSI